MNSRLSSVTFFMLATLMTCYGLIVAKNLLMPLIMAIFLWHLLNTLAAYMKSIYMIGAYLPMPICLMAAVVILASILYQLASIITDNVGEVIVRAPIYQENLKSILASIDQRFHIKVLAYLNDIFQNSIMGCFTSVMGNGDIAMLQLFIAEPRNRGV